MCPLCWYKNLNGSRHEHYATSDTDDLPPSEPSNHAIGPQSFPPMTAVGTVGRASCTIAAYFAIFIFLLFMERGVGVRARYAAERSPLWPVVIRKLWTALSLNPSTVHGGSKSREKKGRGGRGEM